MTEPWLEVGLGVLAFAGGVLATFFAAGGFTRERRSIQQEIDIAQALGPSGHPLKEHALARAMSYTARMGRKPKFDWLHWLAALLTITGAALFGLSEPQALRDGFEAARLRTEAVYDELNKELRRHTP